MNYERSDNEKSPQDLFAECRNLMDFHIVIVMKDGSSVDGVIQNVDANGIIMLVGEDVMSDENDPMQGMNRQFGGHGMRRFRRFRRRGYPFHIMRGIFPIIYPFPFFPFSPFGPF